MSLSTKSRNSRGFFVSSPTKRSEREPFRAVAKFSQAAGVEAEEVSLDQLKSDNAELQSQVRDLQNKVKLMKWREEHRDRAAAGAESKKTATAQKQSDASPWKSIPEYAMSFHEEHKELEGWRGKVLKIMHSPTIQNTIVGLLMLDITCVISEIILESAAFEGFHVSHSLEGFLHNMSFSIMCLFMVEICLYMVAKGPLLFFTQPLEVLDLMVVSGSLYADFHFHSATGQLLMLFRAWRLARICHGVLTAQREFLERKIHKLETENSILKNKLKAETKRRGLVGGRQISARLKLGQR